jgi:predicted transposase/invertase (TIGR01784 family)
MKQTEKFIPFSKDVMFCEVMKHKDICKEIIERIIDRELIDIKYNNPQETFTATAKARSIRLDVCVKTTDGTLIDVEMQVGHYSNLALRFRGYQSIIDASYWKRGEDFNDLKETYIIFLCVDDPFDKQRPVYTFCPVCKEDESINENFRLHWVALNAQAFDKASENISDLLKYIRTNEVSDDVLIHNIHNIVTEVNKDPEKVMKMTTVQDRYDEFQRIIDDQLKTLKSKDREIEELKKQLQEAQRK